MIRKLLTDKALWGFTAIALLLAGACYQKGGGEAVRRGLGDAWAMMVQVGPRLLAAFVMAGFIQVLLPKDLIMRWVGAKSGFRGIVIATAVGLITPGGPLLAFPLLAALFKLGAGYGPLVAYLTSWEILSVYRAAIWDIPFMGIEFTTLRYAVSFFLPLLAGWTAQKISASWESTGEGRE
jgi:uncharacterized membrane protein YraQ (UPF0718 family)